MPPALKPGVIPLRPLSLSDIFNGAFAYIRTNPKATLGLTTIVVIAPSSSALVLCRSDRSPRPDELARRSRGEEVSTGMRARLDAVEPGRRAATWCRRSC